MAKKKRKRKKIRTVPLMIVEGIGGIELFDEEVFKQDLEESINFLATEFIDQYERFKESLENFSDSAINSAEQQKEENMRRNISISLLKKIQNTANMISLNDIHEQANRAELVAAKSAEKAGLPMFKVWITQWDNRVRSWHDFMSHKHEKLDDDFSIPVGNKGYSERIQGPKIPPISPENWVNCRCFLEFKGEKK